MLAASPSPRAPRNVWVRREYVGSPIGYTRLRADGRVARAVAFPNLDTTVHLFHRPRSEWIGYDTTVAFGGNGVGLTHTVLHDTVGPVGTADQILTIRTR